MLLHLGHLGLTSDSITYMRHRGHPARTNNVEVDSELLEYPKLFVFVASLSPQDRHGLEWDRGDSTTAPRLLDLGGERLRLNSRFGLFALRFFIISPSVFSFHLR